jgi:flagellar hook-associated protein 2
VSTGKINAAWESIKMGKLVIDEPLLTKTIRENPEGVLYFFGSDTDGDNRMDTGMAYKLEKVLKPYVMSGSNIISNKIQLETTSIKLANERIKRHQDHLAKYEEKLRKKFSRMERSISESKYQKNWMNQQFGNTQSGKESK